MRKLDPNYRISDESRKPPPPPPPSREALPFLHAFNEISDARQGGMNGPQPIAFVEIQAWLKLNGWRDRSTRSSLVQIVRGLDRVVMAHAAKKLKPAESAATAE